MSVFPPFSGDVCPKCGGPFGTQWHPAKDPTSEEHLHRRCSRCGYECFEALVSPAPKTASEPRYVLIYGIEDVNKKAAEGFRVVAVWSSGAGMTGLMERSGH